MGWTWLHRPNYEDKKAFIYRIYKDLNISDISIKNNAAYLIINPKPEVREALVILLRSDNTDRFNQGLKEIHEDCGPYHVDCPKRIIQSLTSTINPLANEWRNACLEHRCPDYQKVRGDTL